ncbi:MAG: TIGR02281 family clan AA aspartic protease [Gammaproteobacteria bacterium]|nr:TIGR02281 family clan AA aspartic protease [Gammaproteobacteria bacterium]MBU2478113.1 TIGR02281 family clan AA aspartic protease [Gammaproteobacteria bacterium]
MRHDPEQHTPHRLGRGMIILGWILALGLLTLLSDNWLESERNPNRQVLSRVSTDGTPEVVLQRNRFGHYVATGRINGEAVEFMVDTGASDVSVPGSLAAQLGLKRGAPMRYQTANGTITGFLTHIDRLELGNLVLHNVPASINPAYQEDDILLGMSVLKRLEFTQRGDTLTLRPLVTTP